MNTALAVRPDYSTDDHYLTISNTLQKLILLGIRTPNEHESKAAFEKARLLTRKYHLPF